MGDLFKAVSVLVGHTDNSLLSL